MNRLADLVAPARLGRGFRWLMASSWLTNLGDGITLAAGPLLVASQTRNPLTVAMAALLQRLPWLMFGLYAGVVADRVSRRAIVVSTGLARGTILSLLVASIATGHVDTVVVHRELAHAGRHDRVRAAGRPAHRSRAVRRGNGFAFHQRDRLRPRRSTADHADTAAGPVRARAGRHVREEIREGWRWLWSHPPVRTLAITIFTFNITFGAAWSVLVLYARDRLGMGAVGFGLITTAMAAGGLAGITFYGWLERRVPLGVIMRGGLIIETLTHLALALTRWMWLALIVFTIGGIVIGSALGGTVASAWGITAPFWLSFAGSAVILVFIWRSLLQIAHADQDLRAETLAGART